MTVPFQSMVDLLKALAEPTRLRLVRLLSRVDLTVSDLVDILGQSQPRISRHLKLLVEAAILQRYQEGAWAYFRLSGEAVVAEAVSALLDRVDERDPVLTRDGERLEAVRRRRADRASAYFAENAERWDRIRSLHVPDADVEAALLEALGKERVGAFLDVGTGTGRMLELLAPKVRKAVGIDASREMLSVARSKLDELAAMGHASVRQGDAYHLPTEPGGYDLVTLHQVLHYLDDPAAAVVEAAAALAPAGRLAIVDFAPHHLEFLRTEHAHLRLGFSQEAIDGFLAAAGLERETALSLAGSASDADQLTVTITIARDPRDRIALARSA